MKRVEFSDWLILERKKYVRKWLRFCLENDVEISFYEFLVKLGCGSEKSS